MLTSGCKHDLHSVNLDWELFVEFDEYRFGELAAEAHEGEFRLTHAAVGGLDATTRTLDRLAFSEKPSSRRNDLVDPW